MRKGLRMKSQAPARRAPMALCRSASAATKISSRLLHWSRSASTQASPPVPEGPMSATRMSKWQRRRRPSASDRSAAASTRAK